MGKRRQQDKGISSQNNGIAGCDLNNWINRFTLSEVLPILLVSTGNPNSYVLGTRRLAVRTPLRVLSRNTAISKVHQQYSNACIGMEMHS